MATVIIDRKEKVSADIIRILEKVKQVTKEDNLLIYRGVDLSGRPPEMTDKVCPLCNKALTQAGDFWDCIPCNKSYLFEDGKVVEEELSTERRMK